MGASYSQCSNPDCGDDFAICGNTAQLNVQNATIGFWTAYVDDVVLTPTPAFSPNSTSATANVTLTNELNDFLIVSFVWTDNSGPCKDTVVVEFVEIPVVNAGVDFDACGSCTQLNGVSSGFEGTWFPIPGASFVNYADVNTEVCVTSYGEFTFTWLESNHASTTSLSCSDMDEVEVFFWRKPTATILSDMIDSVTCGLSYEDIITQSPEPWQSGYWICPSCGYLWSPMFPDLNDFVVDTPGSYGFYWVLETGPDFMPPGWCNDTAGPLSIHFLNEQPLFAGNDASVFGYSFELNATSDIDYPYSQCVYLWENEAAVFEDVSSLQTSVTVSEYGEYEFILHSYYENLSECIDSDTVKVNFRDPIYLGVEEKTIESLEIFPNPASEFVSISSDKIIISAQIFDINGKLIKLVSDTFENIDISGLEQGMYFVLVFTDNEVLTGKFVR